MSNTPSPRAELVWGLAWIAFGGAIVFGSWTMDRLEKLHIDPWTAPGLVPGVLGVVIALCGLVLAARGVRAGAWRTETGERAAPETAQREPLFNWRVLLSIALCLGFGLGLIGRVPFWAGAALFLLLYVFLFERAERREGRRTGRVALLAVCVAVGGSFVITFVFQELFLVRLP